jgi:hypothetical protein
MFYLIWPKNAPWGDQTVEHVMDSGETVNSQKTHLTAIAEVGTMKNLFMIIQKSKNNLSNDETNDNSSYIKFKD